MSFSSLMSYVRVSFPSDDRRNGSILKQLFRKYPEVEVEAMVRGAKLLGFEDLRIINGKAGEGRRNAMAAFWRSQTRHPTMKMPEPLKDMMRRSLGL